MKKIFALLAVVSLTIATESTIYPVRAECQPDRYGNIIDLGDGNCPQTQLKPKIELQSPETQRLIWAQSTVSDIYFPDWIFDSSLPKPPSIVHNDANGQRMVSYLGRYVEYFNSGLSVATESHEWEASYLDCQTGWTLGIDKNRLDGSIKSWLTTPTADPMASSETRSPAFTYQGIPVWTSNQEWIDGNITACYIAQMTYNMVP